MLNKLLLIQIKLILQNQFDCRASLQQVQYIKGKCPRLQKSSSALHDYSYKPYMSKFYTK